MSDPYYPYGNSNNYHGSYRGNNYGNNQGNDSRYTQYPQGQSRRDYDTNRQWNSSAQPQQWQASPYQQRGGYYDNSAGYMRGDDRRNRGHDNHGHDNRGHDNRGHHSRGSSKEQVPEYQQPTQRPSIFQTTEIQPQPVIAPPLMTYDPPVNRSVEHSGRRKEYNDNQRALDHEVRVDNTYRQDQGRNEQTYQPENRASEVTYQRDEQTNAQTYQQAPQANEDNYQPEEPATTTDRYERDVGCQKDDMISDISDAENPPDDTVLSGTEQADDDNINDENMDHVEKPTENSEIQEDRGVQAEYDDNPEQGSNADQDEQNSETGDQENQNDNVSEPSNNDEDDAVEEQTNDEKEHQEENENDMHGSDDNAESDEEITFKEAPPIEDIPEQDAEENLDANEFAEKIIDENIGKINGESDAGKDDDMVENEEIDNDVEDEEKGTDDQETNEDATAETTQDEGNAEDMAEAEADDKSEAEADDTSEAGADDTAEAKADDTAEAEEDDTAEAEAEDKAESGAQDMAEVGAEDKAESGAEDTAEVGAEDKAESGAEDTAEAGAEDTAEVEADDTAEAEADDTAEAEADDTAEAEADDTAEAGVEDKTESGAETAEAEKENNKATDDAPEKQEGTEEGKGEAAVADKEPDPAPEVEETTPKVKETAPEVEETGPEGEEIAPKVKETAPEVEETAPEVEETAPKVKETAPAVEETDKNNDDIVVTGQELGRPRKRGRPRSSAVAERPEIEEVDKSNDSGNDVVVTGEELGRSRRTRKAPERFDVINLDKDNDSGNDVVVTGEESGRPRRRRAAAAAAEQSQQVVLGTVQSTTISDPEPESAGDGDGAGFRIKEEGAKSVTKWVVGADGNLVRESEDQYANGAPWTQLSFNPPDEGELEPPQGGYLIQIEDLRVGEETHEDVSDFLNIPEEAVDLWRGTKKCPVAQCKGPALTLKHFFDWHWYVFHEQLIKVYYCPVSGCTRMKERWNTRRKRDLIAHLQQKHCVEQFPEAIETQIINNPNYKPPTNFVTLPRAAPKLKPKLAPAAGKKSPAPAKKRAADLLTSVEGVQSEVVDEQAPAEYEHAWKRLKYCPCVGCSKAKMPVLSEMKRHWRDRHVRYTTVYVCPDGDCQVKAKTKGQQLQFRTQNLNAMIKHLTSSAHLLTQTEAQQIGASLIPTQLDNPSYVEPVLCPIRTAPPEAKKPKIVSKPDPVEKVAVDVNAPRASRTGRTAQVETPVVKPEASPAAGGRRSRALNKVAQEITTRSTPSNSDTESLTDSRKRSRHQRGNTDTPQEEPLPKRSRRDNNPEPQLQIATNDRSHKYMTMGELDQFENSREEIIPHEYMEWWSDRNGCPSTVCSASVCHFRIADLIRHWKLRHVKKVPQYYCPIVSCDYNVKHKPSLRKHLASRHNTTPGAVDSIIAKAKAELTDNGDFEPPIHPNKSKSPAKPKASVAKPSPAPPAETVSKSRSGKILSTPAPRPRPGPKSRTMRSSGTAEEVSPISAEVVIALPRVDAATPVRSGRRSTNRGATPASSGKSLEQLAWQPTVNIITLPKEFTNSEGVDLRSRANRSLLSSLKKPPPQQKKPSPVKPSAAKAGPASSKRKAVMSDVRFEADDDDDDSDNFGIDVPMPSMEDAGIATSFFPHKSPGGKHSPAKKGTPASSRSLLQSPGTDDVDDYRTALRALRERQMELERRLESGGGQTVNSDVVQKISALQAQNEALRFQNEALRKQLKSGAMAKQWEDEKKELQTQINNKDVTINTLQDVIARMGTTSSTSNNITNQMINLPGSRPNTRGSQNALAEPPGRMSITPRAGTSSDGNFQKCSVALKSGAKVNFEYENFGDFMQKIGTLNDQYGLNE